ncbi:hypothetical protein BDW72DRAFT_170389 [Aspergillus terricola var. indicus]
MIRTKTVRTVGSRIGLLCLIFLALGIILSPRERPAPLSDIPEETALDFASISALIESYCAQEPSSTASSLPHHRLAEMQWRL